MKLANISAQIIKRASASLVISLLSIALLQLSGCGDSGSSSTGASHPEDTNAISGVAQKGPFQSGSEIRIEQLSEDAQTTLDTLTTKTTGKNSNFSFTPPEHWKANSGNNPLQLTVKGSFFDESHAVNASSVTQQVTLNALLPNADPKHTSINLLTHWASLRAKFLMFREGKTLTAALTQATNELYDYSGIANADKLDISEDKINGSDNLQLLLLSGALLDVAKHYQQSSQHVINQIAVDFAEDGKINHQGKKWFKLIQAHIQNNPEDKTRQYAKILTEHLGRKETLSLDELPNIINFVSRPKANLPPEITVKTGQLVELDGSGSLSASGGSLEYTWVRVDHNNTIPASLNNRFIDKPTLTAPSQSTDLIFALFVTDENGLSDTSLIQVHVTEQGPNNTPVATPPLLGLVTTDEDTPLKITLTGTDKDEGDILTFSTDTQLPIDLTDGIVDKDPDYPTASDRLVYTPYENHYTATNGSGDSFKFKASDGKKDSEWVTVTIKINSVNDAPVVKDDYSVEVNEDSENNKVTPEVTDADNDPIEFTLITGVTHGILELSEDKKEFYYTPTDDYSGDDSFSYQVTDGTVTINNTAYINVISIKDNPNAVSNINPTLVFKNKETVLTLESNDPDDDQIVAYEIDTNPEHGDLSATSQDTPTFTYTPDTDYTGSDEFKFIVTDSTGLTSTVATYKLFISNTQPTVENIPKLSVNSHTNTEATSININLIGTDSDGDDLILNLNADAMQGGSLSNPVATKTGNKTIFNTTYTPKLNFTGADSFTYEVNDGNPTNGTSNLATVKITVLNRAPTANAGDHRTVNTGENVTLNGSGSQDPEGQNLDYKWTQTTGAIVTLSDATAATPNFNAPSSAGDLTFSLEVTDNPVGSTTKKTSLASIVTITVESPNQPPVINSAGIISTGSGGAIGVILSGQTISLTSDVSDPEGDDITYSWSDNPADGTFSSASSATTYYTTPTGISANNTPITLTLIVNDATTEEGITKNVGITINPAPPIAIITGAPTNPVSPGDTITLTGSATGQFNNSIATPTFEWSIPSGITLNSGSTVNDANINFTAPTSTSADGLEFQLIVTDAVTGTTSAPNVVTISVNAVDTSNPFIMKVKGTGTGEWTFTIPVKDINAQDGYDYLLDCGNGSGFTHIADPYSQGIGSCTYSDGLPHDIKIAGKFPRLNFEQGVDASNSRDKLIDIVKWGNIKWDTMSHAFYRCTKLKTVPEDHGPNLSNVDSLELMFYEASSFNSDLSKWDVNGITSMFGMFISATAFNGNITNWDVSNVLNMGAMFGNTIEFTQDLSDWDVSSVTNMYKMFQNTPKFNQDISGWDVSKVTDMTNMFWGARLFNQDISRWNVGKVTNMSSMFANASAFDQDIGSWDISSVTDMHKMFENTPKFNQDISGWDVSKVIDMSGMFWGAKLFNQNISSWDVSSVSTVPATILNPNSMANMFLGATAFNQDISDWDVGNVTDMNNMFNSATHFNNGGLPLSWNSKTSAVTHMHYMFYNATAFNQNIGQWDVSQVTNMDSMFRDAIAFNNGGQPLSWDSKTGAVTNMYKMFANASAFDQDISQWNVSSVTNMGYMFSKAVLFDQNLGSWAINSVTNMEDMFEDIKLSTPNYDSLLTSWIGKRNIALAGSPFSAGNSKYSPSATGARTTFYNLFTNNGANPENYIDGGINTPPTIPSIIDTSNGSGQITLSANATDSEDVNSTLSYEWTIVNGGTGTITDPTNSTATYTPLESTTSVTIQLTVTDSNGSTTTKTIEITLSIDTSNPFVMKIKATGNKFIIPTIPATSISKTGYNFLLDCGDGNGYNPAPVTESDLSTYTFKTCTYPDDGSYDIKIAGTFPRMSFGNAWGEAGDQINRNRLIEIADWGKVHWERLDYAFQRCENLIKVPSTNAALSNVTNMSDMFANTLSFNSDISNWNVSNVTDMTRLFFSAKSFNQDLSNWQVNNVETMRSMFYAASAFDNGGNDLLSWGNRVTKVKIMTHMFDGATIFKQDISNWETDSAENMSYMFKDTDFFNIDLDSWNVSNVTDMSHMFRNAKEFNGKISGWNVGSVETMNGMFKQAPDFNQDLNSWKDNISNVTDMQSMFYDATSFDPDNITDWGIPFSEISSP